MAEVSLDGLEKVKRSLQNFKNEVATVPYTVTNHNQQCHRNALNALNEAQQTIEKLVQQTKELRDKISQLELSIQQNENQNTQLEQQIERSQEQIKASERRAASIQAEIQRVSGLSGEGDSDSQSQRKRAEFISNRSNSVVKRHELSKN